MREPGEGNGVTLQAEQGPGKLWKTKTIRQDLSKGMFQKTDFGKPQTNFVQRCGKMDGTSTEWGNSSPATGTWIVRGKKCTGERSRWNPKLVIL